ncbi:hypothetical protein BC939DRAFT_446156 [Gamsiella multidivaricata]|uniref:uncharacterized protein n=1 Tax=Gamsiella multidivaricata TaxID=101098 RepID=UPI00221F1D62|nr:uncharacterized protein BC939DRAFT_446156 [Gamsiella multidivaricata]KAG0365900.1 hypothetical protein BGZ54_006067 [Gamsiella multidivaricata]KAI7826898.1 hypothetical protein BC939DRAFT_446156 [Gamsiella multidivaricata]
MRVAVDPQSPSFPLLLLLASALANLVQGHPSIPRPPPAPVPEPPAPSPSSIPSSPSNALHRPNYPPNVSILNLNRREVPPSADSAPHFASLAEALAAPVALAQSLAWVDYYTPIGGFVSEDTASSGDCLRISRPSWGIINITPMTSLSDNAKDQVQLYNDLNCGVLNREPASQTGLTLISWYFFNIPQSLRWTRILPSLPATTTVPKETTTAATTTTITTTIANTTAATMTATLTTTMLTTSSTPTTSPITTPVSKPPTPSGDAPTPIRTTFPTALIPPKPMDATSGWGNSCNPNSTSTSGSQPDCKGATRKVNQVLIVGITVAVLVVGLMAAGAFYIYRTFYTPPEDSFPGSSAFIGTGAGVRSNPRTAYGGGTGGGSGHDDDYQYIHDEDENSPPRFMFDHRHDNINTNKNPKLFKENVSDPSSSSNQQQTSFGHSPSDISLIERTK